jgi:hypothetical protein
MSVRIHIYEISHIQYSNSRYGRVLSYVRLDFTNFFCSRERVYSDGKGNAVPILRGRAAE